MSTESFDGHWKVDGKTHALAGHIDDTHVAGTVDGVAVEFLHRSSTSDIFIAGVRTRVVVVQRGGRILLSMGGRSFEFERILSAGTNAGAGAVAADAYEPFAVSPMTGLVTKVHVSKGDRVAKGAPLFAVEAMKMEYVVRADRDVGIAKVMVVAGTRISVNEPGVTFEAPVSP